MHVQCKDLYVPFTFFEQLIDYNNISKLRVQIDIVGWGRVEGHTYSMTFIWKTRVLVLFETICQQSLLKHNCMVLVSKLDRMSLRSSKPSYLFFWLLLKEVSPIFPKQEFPMQFLWPKISKRHVLCPNLTQTTKILKGTFSASATDTKGHIVLVANMKDAHIMIYISGNNLNTIVN